jgi:Terpene cyclase DEP1
MNAQCRHGFTCKDNPLRSDPRVRRNKLDASSDLLERIGDENSPCLSLFALVGLILPYSQFLPWIVEHQALNISFFMRDLFANKISAFFALDVIVSAIVLILFIHSEGKRLRMRLLRLPTIGTLIVGVSLGLPLFLYLRQVALDRTGAGA